MILHTTRRLSLQLPLLGLLLLLSCGRDGANQNSGNDTIIERIENAPTAQGEVKIEVSDAGLYAVDASDLRAAGLQFDSLTLENVSLTQAGVAVPIYIVDDRLLFYGRAPSTIYTEFRPYILALGKPGVAMASASAAATGAPNLNTITRPLHLEQNSVYASIAHTDQFPDGWYWHTLHVEQKYEFTAELPAVAEGGSATAQFHLFGASLDPNVENDHDFDFVVNGQKAGTVRWDGQTHFVGSLALPAGALKQGTNSFLLDNSVPGATFVDIMQFDWLTLRYAATPTAVNDTLDFFAADGIVSLTGFSAQPLIFDITAADAPVHLTDWTYDSATGSAILTVHDQHYLAAAAPAGWLKPARITNLRSGDLRTADQQADLIIIASDALTPPLEPLVAAREAQGLSVRIANLQEIYDTFGAGESSPLAIQAFLRHATAEWAAPAPRYLLLVGDGTYDYRNYTGLRPQNHLPSLMIPVTHSGETVSDARLADVDGDFRPDLAVGRWPVDSAAEVEALVRRTLAYEAGSASPRAILSADGTSSEFTALSDYLLDNSPLQSGESAKLYGANFNEVASAWNQGAWLVTYVGHGSLNLWGKDNVFTTEAVSAINGPANPPIVLQFTCLTGFFAHPTDTSISETLLRHENGPVLLVAATSLTLSAHQRPFALNLLNGLFKPELTRIGDVIQFAKGGLDMSQTGPREISDTFGLLGDPSALVIRPTAAAQSN